MAWFYLAAAISFELFGTTALKLSDGFSKWYWTLATMVGYGLAFYFLSLVVKTIPLGLSYGIWSGIGTMGAALISVWIFKTEINPIGWIGVIFVIAGVVLLNLGTNSH